MNAAGADAELQVLALVAQAVAGRVVAVERWGMVRSGLVPCLASSDALRVFLPPPRAEGLRGGGEGGGARIPGDPSRALLLLQLAIRNWQDAADEAQRQGTLRTSPPLLRRLTTHLEELRAAATLLCTHPGVRRDLASLWSTPPPRLVTAFHALARRAVLHANPTLIEHADLRAFVTQALAGTLRWQDSFALAQRLAPPRRRGFAIAPLQYPDAPLPPGPHAQALPPDDGPPGALNRMAAPGAPLPRSTHATRWTASAVAASGNADPPPPATVPPAPPGAQAFFVDEWDCDRAALRARWCRILQRRPRAADATALQQALVLLADLIAQAAQPAARNANPARGDLLEDGAELDLQAAIAEWVDRRAGCGGGTRFYRQPPPPEGAAVAVLLDVSASTDLALQREGESEPPAPAADDDLLWQVAVPRRTDSGPTRRILDAGREATAALLAWAEARGAAAAAFSYGGNGRHQVDMTLLQDFDAADRGRSLEHLAGLVPGGATRTGAALRHAGAQLLARPEPDKLLVLITDGYPQDSDYGTDASPRYGIEDTRHAWDALRDAGVRLLCVAIDPAGYGFHVGFCRPEEAVAFEGVAGMLAVLEQR